jgi:hypothetical protein
VRGEHAPSALIVLRVVCQSRDGFTLIELLVATGVFMMLGVLLVGLLASGLEIWNRGESQRDLHERAHVVLSHLRQDLDNVYVERLTLPYPAWVDSESKLKTADRNAVMEVTEGFLRNLEHLRCGVDALERQWLCFLKSGREDGKTVPDIKDCRFPSASIANNLTYVLYTLDPNPKNSRLCRGVFPLTDATAFLGPEAVVGSKDLVGKNCFTLAQGVLYFGLRFWTQHADTWDTTYPPKIRKNQSEKIGPELRWDSTRRLDKGFILYEPAPPPTGDTPVNVLPEMILVELTLRPAVRRKAESALAGDVEVSSNKITVDTARGLPEPPNYVKIDDEWILYSKVTGESLEVKARGARGTKAQKHKKGASVLHGIDFNVIIRLPSYREAK